MQASINYITEDYQYYTFYGVQNESYALLKFFNQDYSFNFLTSIDQKDDNLTSLRANEW